MSRFPLASLLLAALMLLLMVLPSGVQELLYFNSRHLQQGMPTGLVTGHWIHADGEHLWWNLGAFLILAPLVEMHSRGLLFRGLIMGTLCVDLLLLAPWTELQRYCGLSGVLNTLFGIALCLCWQRTRSPMVPAVAVFGAIKIALEITSGQAVFTEISWPPFALAHLAGILGAPLAIWWSSLPGGERKSAITAAARSHHGDLVTGK